SSDNQQAIPLSAEKRASIDPTLQMTGVRHGDDKMLYNMWGEDTIALWNIAKDYKETTNLYSKGTEADKALATKYRNEVVAWYEDLLKNDKSYQMPTFQIGREAVGGQTQIFGYAPIETSEGVLNTNHYITDFNEVGEAAKYNVNVVTDGRYTLGIRLQKAIEGEVKFKVSTNLDENCGEIVLTKKSTTWLNIPLTSEVSTIGIELITPADRDMRVVSIDVIRKK
ncbi:MAG: hypothetical protein SNI70_09285, partial [Rikenellaceae bacterium]